MKRGFLLGPVTFTIFGVAAGLCLAMLYRHNEDRAHVHIWDSVPLAFLGGLVGAVAGEIVRHFESKKPQLRFGLTVLSGMLLAASVAAVIGWIVGEYSRGRPGVAGMAWGAASGCVIGPFLGLVQAIKDRRQEKNEASLPGRDSADDGSSGG